MLPSEPTPLPKKQIGHDIWLLLIAIIIIVGIAISFGFMMLSQSNKSKGDIGKISTGLKNKTATYVDKETGQKIFSVDFPSQYTARDEQVIRNEGQVNQGVPVLHIIDTKQYGGGDYLKIMAFVVIRKGYTPPKDKTITDTYGPKEFIATPAEFGERLKKLAENPYSMIDPKPGYVTKKSSAGPVYFFNGSYSNVDYDYVNGQNVRKPENQLQEGILFTDKAMIYIVRRDETSIELMDQMLSSLKLY